LRESVGQSVERRSRPRILILYLNVYSAVGTYPAAEKAGEQRYIADWAAPHAGNRASEVSVTTVIVK